MTIPIPSREGHMATMPGDGINLWIARIELAEDKALAERVVLLGVRARNANGQALKELDAEEQVAHDTGERMLRYSLVQRLRMGTLVARGFPEGCVECVTVPREAWENLVVDWFNNTIELYGVTVRGVVVSPVPISLTMTAQQLGPVSSQRPRGRSFRAQDAPLAEEGAQMILDGRARNPSDAARALVPRIVGDGNADSKIKRLAPRIGRRAEELRCEQSE